MKLTSPGSILQQGDVDGAGRQVDVAHDGAADEDVLDGAEVGVAQLLVDRDVVELDVEVLVDRLEGARHLDVVLELDGDGLVDEGLEEAVSFRLCTLVMFRVLSSLDGSMSIKYVRLIR